jgi:hypothetical protein
LREVVELYSRGGERFSHPGPLRHRDRAARRTGVHGRGNRRPRGVHGEPDRRARPTVVPRSIIRSSSCRTGTRATPTRRPIRTPMAWPTI